jgi:hypothetical protein
VRRAPERGTDHLAAAGTAGCLAITCPYAPPQLGVGCTKEVLATFSGGAADRHRPTGPTADAAVIHHSNKEGVRLLTWGDPYLTRGWGSVRRAACGGGLRSGRVCLPVSVTDPGRPPAVPEALRFDCPPADQFAELALADFGGDYASSVGSWDRPAERPVMHRQDHGKALWRFLDKKFDPAPKVIVFADGGGDRRALSLAYAVADVNRWPRQTQVFCPTAPEARHDGAPAPNKHGYETARRGRLVVIR